MCTQENIYEGWHIPKGSLILPNRWLVFPHPLHFPDIYTPIDTQCTLSPQSCIAPGDRRYSGYLDFAESGPFIANYALCSKSGLVGIVVDCFAGTPSVESLRSFS
jgi:hypothetical protein